MFRKVVISVGPRTAFKTKAKKAPDDLIDAFFIGTLGSIFSLAFLISSPKFNLTCFFLVCYS